MKKAFPMLAVLLVLAGVIAFTMRRAGGGGARFPFSRAAELAPTETVWLIQFSDLERTRTRWEQRTAAVGPSEPKGYGGIWTIQDPEWLVGEFNSDGFVGMYERLWRDLKKVEAPGLFLAATSLAYEPLPKIVGGFPYRGKKADLERLLQEVKGYLFAEWAGAKSELGSHRGIEIETITNTLWAKGTVPPPALHLAFRDDWLFFATDRALLTGLLDRYLGGPEARPGLAQNPVFAACRAHEVPEADVVMWMPWAQVRAARVRVNWTTFQLRLPVLIGVWDDQANEMQAAHYSLKVGHPGSDRLYLHLTRPPQARDVASPVTPDSRGFSSVDFDAFRSALPKMNEALLRDANWTRLGIQLWEQKLTAEDVWEAFGPRVSMVHSEQDFATSPKYLVAAEVRDAAKARNFVEALAAQAKEPVRVLVEGATTRWEWSSEPWGYVRPPLILTKTHLLFGASPNSGTSGTWWRYFLDPATLLKKGAGEDPAKSELQAPRSKATLPWPALWKHLHPRELRVQPAGLGWEVTSETQLVADYFRAKSLSDAP